MCVCVYTCPYNNDDINSLRVSMVHTDSGPGTRRTILPDLSILRLVGFKNLHSVGEEDNDNDDFYQDKVSLYVCVLKD
jgi:hypothetical protein